MNPWSFVFWEAVAILLGIGAVWLGRRRYGVDLVATVCGAYLGGMAASALIADAGGWSQIVAVGAGVLGGAAVSWTFVRDGDRQGRKPRSNPATPPHRPRHTATRRGRRTFRGARHHVTTEG